MKAIGAQGWRVMPYALDEPDNFREIGFPRRGRPRVEPGDRLVLYGAEYQTAFAAVEVESEPTFVVKPGEERWPWRVRVRPLLIVPNVRDGAPLSAGSVRPASMRQRSHLRLDKAQYNAFVDAMAAAARAA